MRRPGTSVDRPIINVKRVFMFLGLPSDQYLPKSRSTLPQSCSVAVETTFPNLVPCLYSPTHLDVELLVSTFLITSPRSGHFTSVVYLSANRSAGGTFANFSV